MQSFSGQIHEMMAQCIGTESESFVAGTIVDSWVESAKA